MPFSVPARTIACPAHPEEMTPTQARFLALELVSMADEAEGRRGPTGFVTRWEVLAELETLRREVARLARQDNWT